MRKATGARIQGKWTRQAYQRTRRTVADLVTEWEAELGPGSVLARLVEQIATLRNRKDRLEQMLQFAYVLAAFEQHARHGGMNQGDGKALATLAERILADNQVDVATSRMSILRADLHRAFAAVRARDASWWEATWQDLLAQHARRRSFRQDEMQPDLALARALLRDGFAGYAAETAAPLLEVATHRAEALQILVAAHRMRGELAQARALLDRGLSQLKLAAEARTALQWQALKLEVAESGDVSVLFAAFDRHDALRVPELILEAFLYAHAWHNTTWSAKQPQLRTLLGKKAAGVAGVRPLYDLLARIEASYDTEREIFQRLREAEDVPVLARRVGSIEQELLGYAAFARWLARAHAFPAAKLALLRYQSLSYQVSDARTGDALVLMADLLAKRYGNAS